MQKKHRKCEIGRVCDNSQLADLYECRQIDMQ